MNDDLRILLLANLRKAMQEIEEGATAEAWLTIQRIHTKIRLNAWQ
jgi:hypothetical protein